VGYVEAEEVCEIGNVRGHYFLSWTPSGGVHILIKY